MRVWPYGRPSVHTTPCDVDVATHRLIMASITWLLILYSCAGVLWVLYGMTTLYFILFGILYCLLTALCLWAHVKTMLTDPGAVPRSARPLPSARDAGIPETICGRCDAYKPPRSHHCRICGRCVVSRRA